MSARKKWWLISSGFLGFLIVMAALAFVYIHFRAANHRSAIPEHIINTVSFPVYAPDRELPGFILDEASTSATSQVVTYNYTYDDTKKLIISIQPMSSDIDPNQFRPTKEFTTTIGKAYIVDLDSRTTAAVVTDESFILINAPSGIAVDAMEQFINSLRKS